MPPSCALLGGFAVGARVALLWQHNANPSYYKLACTPRYDDIVRTRNVSECSVLGSMPSYAVLFVGTCCVLIDRQEDAVPDMRDIVRLSRRCAAGSTLMWAVVDSGDVTFFAFHPVTLPADVDVATT